MIGLGVHQDIAAVPPEIDGVHVRAAIHRIDIGDLGPGKEKQVIVITAY